MKLADEEILKKVRKYMFDYPNPFSDTNPHRWPEVGETWYLISPATLNISEYVYSDSPFSQQVLQTGYVLPTEQTAEDVLRRLIQKMEQA